MTGVLRGRDENTGKTTGGHRTETAVSKPKREAAEETRTVRNCEDMYFCCDASQSGHFVAVFPANSFNLDSAASTSFCN